MAPRERIVEDACSTLQALGAPARLVKHGQLVAEAAQALLEALDALGVRVDEDWVLKGAVLHDAGKALHPGELTGPGHRHETEGEALLLRHGVPARIARCARSHAEWATLECALEELLVALSDTLWKGVRKEALEGTVVDRLAALRAVDRWELFIALDTCFEAIAAGASDRLERSTVES